MALAAKSLRIDSRGAVSVRVACPASEPGGCSGVLSLETLVRVGGSKRVTRPNRSRKQLIKFGKGSFQVAGGKSTGVRIRLSRKHKLLVGKLTKVEALATINARDAAGNARTTKISLTLKAAKRSR
jgi:hypothetical protein